MGWGGGLCDYCVSLSPFDLDFGTLDFGTLDLGLTIITKRNSVKSTRAVHMKYSGKMDVLCVYLYKNVEVLSQHFHQNEF